MLQETPPDPAQGAYAAALVHREKHQPSYWSGLVSHRSEPTLLLDEQGRALRASDGLTRLLACDEALDLVDRRLRASLEPDDARLQRMLGDALAREAPRSGALRVTRRSGRPPLVLTAVPLPRASGWLAPAEAAALVTVVDPAAAVLAAADLWRDAFGFSARERDVAALLMVGHSVESAAATLAISGATARVHMRRLLSKTDCARQSELTRLLSRVG